MCLFTCNPSHSCRLFGPQTFILAVDQSPHPNIYQRYQPDPSIKPYFHLGKNYPTGDCISILPCAYCLTQDPSMLSYWWRVPRNPVVDGAAVRPRILWKMERLFEWEMLSKEEIGGFEKNGGVLVKRKDSVALRSLDGAIEADNGEGYDPFAGLADPRKPLVATPKRRKSIKAVAWADLERTDEESA